MSIASLEGLENSSLLSIYILPCPESDGGYQQDQLEPPRSEKNENTRILAPVLRGSWVLSVDMVRALCPIWFAIEESRDVAVLDVRASIEISGVSTYIHVEGLYIITRWWLYLRIS